MNRNFLLAMLALFIDRITKSYALASCVQECVITKFLSFQLTFNKGISWGMLHGSSLAIFWLMTAVISLVTVSLVFYARKRRLEGFSILGETLVITGALSNITDRFLYGGVIDFIMLHKNAYVWPLFNIADVCIVVGVFIMAIQLFTAK